MINRQARGALLHSQRTDGGDEAGFVGLSLTERKAPTRTAREISADLHGSGSLDIYPLIPAERVVLELVSAVMPTAPLGS
jgi:hypothetical protein